MVLPVPVPLPERIARYRLERLLGEGGMGRVFEAVDLQLGRRVAIKVIRDDLEDPAARARFFREARAAAAPVASARVSAPRGLARRRPAPPFLVMELLEGEPLSAALERGPMSADRCGGGAGAADERARAAAPARVWFTATSSRPTCSSPHRASNCSTSGWRAARNAATRCSPPPRPH